MAQLERMRQRERIHVGAYIDSGMRDELVELARERDRSVSSILRRALRAELDRASQRQRED